MDVYKRCHYSYNWLMYLHFVRQDQDAVKKLYNGLPDERRDEQIYKTVQGLTSKLRGNLQEAHSQILEAIHYNDVPNETGDDDGQPEKDLVLQHFNASKQTDNDDLLNSPAEEPSNDAQISLTNDVFSQYLSVEDVATLALHGHFKAALAATERLRTRYDSATLSTLWKLPFFRAFIAERNLVRSNNKGNASSFSAHNVTASSFIESQQQDSAVAAVRAELAKLINGICSEDAVYQALARLSRPLNTRFLLSDSSHPKLTQNRSPDAESRVIEENRGQSQLPVTSPTPSTRDVVEQALQRHPSNIDLIDTQVRSYLCDHSYDAVLRLLLAQQQAGVLLQHAQNVDLAFVSGLAGDLDMSLTRAKLGACQSAYSTAAWNNIGVALIERRKHVTGIGSMRFSRSLDVTNWMALHNLGFVHLKMGLFASATIFLTAAYRYGAAASFGHNNNNDNDNCGAATVFLLSMCVRELGNRMLARRLMLNASRLIRQDDVGVIVFLIPALIEAGEYAVAIEVYHKFADIVKFMRGDTIRHQQMRRTDLSQQLDYFATHVPDIVQLITYMQQEGPSITGMLTSSSHIEEPQDDDDDNNNDDGTDVEEDENGDENEDK